MTPPSAAIPIKLTLRKSFTYLRLRGWDSSTEFCDKSIAFLHTMGMSSTVCVIAAVYNISRARPCSHNCQIINNCVSILLPYNGRHIPVRTWLLNTTKYHVVLSRPSSSNYMETEWLYGWRVDVRK